VTPLLVLLAALASAALAETPGVAREDWDETLAALAAAGATVSARDLVELAGPAARPRNFLAWQRRWRSGGGSADLLAADLLAGPASARLRLRAGTGRRREATGAVRVDVAGLSLTAGWWSWQAGFGLLAGAAGRRPGLTADAGVMPRRSGPRGWTGAPEGRSLRGAAAVWQAGSWRVGAAAGLPAGSASTARTVCAAAGRADGRWTAMSVFAGGELVGLGGAGRWESGAWRGAWEVVWQPATMAFVPPAVGAALEWRPGRYVNLGGVYVSSPGRGVSPLASGHELTGTRGGDGWAARGAWQAAPQVRFFALVSGRHRRMGGPGRERRRLLELQARYRANTGLEARVRYRGTNTDAAVWDADWPWEPPGSAPLGRRRTLGLTLVRTLAGPRADVTLRADLRTLTLTGAGTSGRRSLLGLEFRRRTDRGTVLRAGWHEAWGDPVDLVSAVSPLPGRLAARHWGAWRGEIWGGLAHVGRRGALSAAVHLRRPREEGPDVVECRTELRWRW